MKHKTIKHFSKCDVIKNYNDLVHCLLKWEMKQTVLDCRLILNKMNGIQLVVLFFVLYCQSEFNMDARPQYVFRLLMTMGTPLDVAGRQGQSASLSVMHYRQRRLIA